MFLGLAGDVRGTLIACPPPGEQLDYMRIYRCQAAGACDGLTPPPKRGLEIHFDPQGCAYWVDSVIVGYTEIGQPVWGDRASQEAQDFQAVQQLRNTPAPTVQNQSATVVAAGLPSWAYYAGAAGLLLLLMRR